MAEDSVGTVGVPAERWTGQLARCVRFIFSQIKYAAKVHETKYSRKINMVNANYNSGFTGTAEILVRTAATDRPETELTA
jgi:hypothetical protein